jgi:3-oxoacyl-[acyl-carrier-protein] synthase-3
VSGPDECASDLGVAAARKLFDEGLCSPDQIDFLILVTQMPDYFMPTSACLVQDRLGLPTSCGAIDINLGCSGFIYGLAMAKSVVESGVARNVLLITSDTYTKWINPQDRSTRTLFGDGAAATFVTAVESDAELIGPFVLGTDGKGVKDIVVPAGGFRCPPTAETKVEKKDETGSVRSAENLYMNGGEVLGFTLKVVPPLLPSCNKSGVTMDEVDGYPRRRTNPAWNACAANCKYPRGEILIDMKESGNTVSATIPIALETALNQGRLAPAKRATRRLRRRIILAPMIKIV